MVKKLSPQEIESISDAVSLAEHQTQAEIATVIVPASDTYYHHLMVMGFVLGSFVDLVLWWQHIMMQFPLLLLIQLFATLFMPLLPGVHQLGLLLLPKKLTHYRAALLGAEELMALNRQAPVKTPILLIFVSLAERYIHLFPNEIVRHSVVDAQWDVLVAEFKKDLSHSDLTSALVTLINKVAAVLTPVFPDDGQHNLITNHVQTTRSKKL